jgi:hypothetical protein
MQRNVSVIPATCAHVIAMAERLRADDVAELQAAGIGVNRALWRSWRISMFAKTALVDGELAAMWGIDGHGLGNTGRPWLLTTAAVERAPIAVLKVGRAEAMLMLSICPRLVGFVDSRYERAVRVLAMWGFSLSSPFPFGPHGVPFRQYEMRR